MRYISYARTVETLAASQPIPSPILLPNPPPRLSPIPSRVFSSPPPPLCPVPSVQRRRTAMTAIAPGSSPSPLTSLPPRSDLQPRNKDSGVSRGLLFIAKRLLSRLRLLHCTLLNRARRWKVRFLSRSLSLSLNLLRFQVHMYLWFLPVSLIS